MLPTDSLGTGQVRQTLPGFALVESLDLVTKFPKYYRIDVEAKGVKFAINGVVEKQEIMTLGVNLSPLNFFQVYNCLGKSDDSWIESSDDCVKNLEELFSGDSIERLLWALLLLEDFQYLVKNPHLIPWTNADV